MLKQFCSRCGQPVEADDSWAGHRLACPGCGLMMSWPRSGNSSRRRQIFTALAVLLLLGLLAWLLLRPASFGSAGGAARDGIFGRHLAGLAGGDGRDPSGSPDSSGETNNAPTNRNRVSPPAPASRPAPTPSPATAPREGSPENAPPAAPAASPVAPSTNAVSTNLPTSPASAPVTVRLNDDFSQRLSAAGAKTGEVQVSLIWNNVNDLDLHCIDPMRP